MIKNGKEEEFFKKVAILLRSPLMLLFVHLQTKPCSINVHVYVYVL
jgi:hypothetical protein